MLPRNINRPQSSPSSSCSAELCHTQENNFSPALKLLANNLHQRNRNNAPFSGIGQENIHTVFQAMAEFTPYAHLALQEACAQSKTFADLDTQATLPRFFRAKTAHQLPPVMNLLEHLNISVDANNSAAPQAHQVLTTLINRQIPNLIQTNLEYFERTGRHGEPHTKDLECLHKLITFIHTLITHPSAQTRSFWAHPFNPELDNALGALLQHIPPHQVGSLNRETMQQQIKSVIYFHKKLNALRLLRNGTATDNPLMSPLNKDKEFVLTVIKIQGGEWLRHASLDLRNDSEVVMAAVSEDGDALQYASRVLRANREIVLAAVLQHPWSIRHADPMLLANREIILAAVSGSGTLISYATLALQNDREIVLTAASNTGIVLRLLEHHFREDRELASAAVQNYGEILEILNDELRSAPEIVLAAVSENGLALEFASKALRADKNIVLAAVSENGLALEFASEELRADKDIVLAAVKQDSAALEFASEELRADREIALAAVQNDPDAFDLIDETLWLDPEIRRAANLPED